jgi:hypothetical protein
MIIDDASNGGFFTQKDRNRHRKSDKFRPMTETELAVQERKTGL